MKVRGKTQTVLPPLAELRPGDVFRYGGDLYMLAEGSANIFRHQDLKTTIRLTDGKAVEIMPGTQVERVSGVFTEE